MGILIPVDIPDFLDASGHLAAPSQVIKKHEPAVKINAFQDIVGHDDPEKGHIILLLLEFIIQISYKCIAAQKVFILLPLVQYSVPLHRTADGVQHIAVALAVHRLLKSLYGKAQIHLIGCDILGNTGQVCCLDGI